MSVAWRLTRETTLTMAGDRLGGGDDQHTAEQQLQELNRA